MTKSEVEGLLARLAAVATEHRLTQQRTADAGAYEFPSELDKAVMALLQGLRAVSISTRTDVGARLDGGASSALYRFALRAAMNAVRTADPGLIRDGLEALVIQVAYPDARDNWQPVAALYRSGEILGVNVRQLFDEAAAFAPGETSGFVREFPGRDPRSRSLAAWKLEERGAGNELLYVSCIPKIDDPESATLRRLLARSERAHTAEDGN